MKNTFNKLNKLIIFILCAGGVYGNEPKGMIQDEYIEIRKMSEIDKNNLNNTLEKIDSNIKEKSMDIKHINIDHLGISPFTISVIGYELNLNTYKIANKNIKQSEILHMTTSIDLNKEAKEGIKFETDGFDFVRNTSLLVKKNGIRDIKLEQLLKGKNELGQAYVKIDEDNLIIKIDYPKQMNTYDKYEILIYMRTTLNKNQRIDRYISEYVKSGKQRRINIENRAEIQYEVVVNYKGDLKKYSKNICNKSETTVPYKYPPYVL